MHSTVISVSLPAMTSTSTSFNKELFKANEHEYEQHEYEQDEIQIIDFSVRLFFC
jgi:hypothetical protein